MSKMQLNIGEKIFHVEATERFQDISIGTTFYLQLYVGIVEYKKISAHYCKSLTSNRRYEIKRPAMVEVYVTNRPETKG